MQEGLVINIFSLFDWVFLKSFDQLLMLLLRNFKFVAELSCFFFFAFLYLLNPPYYIFFFAFKLSY